MKKKCCEVEGCFKPIWGNKQCKYHNAINSLNNPKKRQKKYQELRDEYIKDNPNCERCGTTENLTLHHRRGRVGDNLLKHFCTLCFNCHRFVEDNPQYAHENGYSLKRNFKYDDK